MTVAELIEQLQEQDPNLPVYFHSGGMIHEVEAATEGRVALGEYGAVRGVVHDREDYMDFDYQHVYAVLLTDDLVEEE